MAGGDVGVALRGEPGRLGVAGVARPRLQVALRPARAVDRQRHAEPLAQRGAVGGVLGGGVAQAVVDVQRARRARDPHREVEQADRVRPAGEQHDDRRARAQQALLADERLEAHAGTGRARNSSVDSLKPLSLTSPMRSNSRCEPPASTSGRVTSTSPPAARAPTRAARLTARP